MPRIRRTIAMGVVGVKTLVDSREVVKRLSEIVEEDPSSLWYTVKWVPVDRWTSSDMDSMRKTIIELRSMIKKGEKWRMTVEKRRFTMYHSIDIIKELAELIDEEVNLKNPDKILRIDIIGRYAGISVLSPNEVFSVTKAKSF